MGSKHFIFNWLILINGLVCISAVTGNGQNPFENYQAFFIGIDSTVNISNFDKTYIVHFNFCSSPKYCGDNLIRYIEKDKNKKILIICDDPKNKYLLKLKNNFYRFVSVDFLLLDRHGLFSVYNIEITKKRKVRKLL
jgi:hypothetical protein